MNKINIAGKSCSNEEVCEGMNHALHHGWIFPVNVEDKLAFVFAGKGADETTRDCSLLNYCPFCGVCFSLTLKTYLGAANKPMPIMYSEDDLVH